MATARQIAKGLDRRFSAGLDFGRWSSWWSAKQKDFKWKKKDWTKARWKDIESRANCNDEIAFGLSATYLSQSVADQVRRIFLLRADTPNVSSNWAPSESEPTDCFLPSNSRSLTHSNGVCLRSLFFERHQTEFASSSSVTGSERYEFSLPLTFVSESKSFLAEQISFKDEHKLCYKPVPLYYYHEDDLINSKISKSKFFFFIIYINFIIES